MRWCRRRCVPALSARWRDCCRSAPRPVRRRARVCAPDLGCGSRDGVDHLPSRVPESVQGFGVADAARRQAPRAGGHGGSLVHHGDAGEPRAACGTPISRSTSRSRRRICWWSCAATPAACDEALAAAETIAASSAATSGGDAAAFRLPLTSIALGLERAPEADLALISVPGDYAAAEAMKALALGPRRDAVLRQRHPRRRARRSRRTRATRTASSWGPTAARPSSTACRWASPTSCGAATSVSSRRPAPACRK